MKKLLLLLLLVASGAQGEMYTWKDARGTAFYTNSLHEIPARYRSRAKLLDVATGKKSPITTPPGGQPGPAAVSGQPAPAQPLVQSAPAQQPQQLPTQQPPAPNPGGPPGASPGLQAPRSAETQPPAAQARRRGTRHRTSAPEVE
jgi:hypothetical protein